MGIDGAAPAGLIRELRADLLGEWLPLALADILSAWSGEKRPEILRGWGLDAMADRADDASLSAFLSNFRNQD